MIFVIIGMMSAHASAGTSPAACRRSESSIYINSDSVVEAVVKQSRRWSEGTVTLHLVVQYKILDVFKGDVIQDEILIVTDTCLDEPIPRHMLGYPPVEDYCRGGIGLTLTGVNSGDGKPVMKSEKNQHGFCSLRKTLEEEPHS
mgnify:CR=1 FL=1